MMKNEFTPGPWKIVEAGRDTIIRTKIVDICTISRLYAIDAKDSDANARLIAAAPDLLAALESLLDMCKPCDGMPDSRKSVIDASAAISKARGA